MSGLQTLFFYLPRWSTYPALPYCQPQGLCGLLRLESIWFKKSNGKLRLFGLTQPMEFLNKLLRNCIGQPLCCHSVLDQTSPTGVLSNGDFIDWYYGTTWRMLYAKATFIQLGRYRTIKYRLSWNKDRILRSIILSLNNIILELIHIEMSAFLTYFYVMF